MTRESVDKRVRVLVVEDIETTRSMYVRNLDLWGDYHIDTAADLSEAMSRLEAITYHVALVDIMLAGAKDTANRDGTKVLERIRELDEGTRAVVLSAQKETQTVRDFLKGHGAFDYLAKDDLLASGIGKMIEFVDAAGQGSPVGEDPSWETVVGSLAGDRDEPAFVSEVMGKLRFGGGFENLRRTLAASVRHLLPLMPTREGPAGLELDEERGTMTGCFWSKGQGRAIEFALAGKDRSPGGAEQTTNGVILEREKAGLSVVVSELPGASRDAFDETAK